MTSVPIYGPRPVGVSFHDEKFDAEDKLRAAGAPVTILRLTSFMDNLTGEPTPRPLTALRARPVTIWPLRQRRGRRHDMCGR